MGGHCRLCRLSFSHHGLHSSTFPGRNSFWSPSLPGAWPLHSRGTQDGSDPPAVCLELYLVRSRQSPLSHPSSGTGGLTFPWLDPLTLLIASPTIAINLLSSLPTTYALDRFHYSAMIVPFVVASAINGTAFLVNLAQQKRGFSKSFLYAIFMAMILMTTLIYHLKFGHTPLSLGFQWPVSRNSPSHRPSNAPTRPSTCRRLSADSPQHPSHPSARHLSFSRIQQRPCTDLPNTLF